MPFTPDIDLMRLALRLARRAEGRTSPNPMVGAVIEKNGVIIATGYHKRAGGPHAEAEALARAGAAARGATLYVTFEPCAHHSKTPPCADAVIAAGIRRVVAGMRDPNPIVSGRGFRKLRRAGVEVISGVLEDEVRSLNRFFCCYHEKRRPFIIAKWAMSADGRTATDAGDSKWISSEASRAHVHHLRASVDAVAVGIGTVLADDPILTARPPAGRRPARQPWRIVFDSRGRIPLDARILGDDPERFILATTKAIKPLAEKALLKRGCQVWKLPKVAGGRRINLRAAVERMHQARILSVLLEGGRELAGGFITEQLADQAFVFMAPKIIGGEALRSPLAGPGAATMKNALQLHNVRIRQFGGDICMEGEIQ